MKKLITVMIGSLLVANSVYADDLFLAIDDVAGESEDSTHVGEIDIQQWSWGLYSVGGKSGGACTDGMFISKEMDSASPVLIQAIEDNTSFAEATLTVRSGGSNPLEYLVLRMKVVNVSNFSSQGYEGGGKVQESFSLSFDSVEGAYTLQDGDGGAGAILPYFIKPNCK